MVVGVVFGGKSCEHDISVITGVEVMSALSRRHTLAPIYIDEAGEWRTCAAYAHMDTFRCGEARLRKIGKRVHFRASSPYLYSDSGKKLFKIDVCILANHGLNGEDGSVQGLLQLAGVPYTGSGVRASSVGMDKITMKQVFSACNLPILPYVAFDSDEYNADLYSIVTRIKQNLTFPLMVKPSNLGSSIGISKTHDLTELFAAVRMALEWDSRVIVENALTDFVELNCAVFCKDGVFTPSEVEKPVGWKEFLTFEDKYMTKSSGPQREFPAVIADELKLATQNLAVATAKSIGASGVARVDFLYSDKLYVNEINTIPGAMANYLFDTESGMPFEMLLEKLIEDALCRQQRANKLKYSYRSPRSIKIDK